MSFMESAFRGFNFAEGLKDAERRRAREDFVFNNMKEDRARQEHNIALNELFSKVRTLSAKYPNKTDLINSPEFRDVANDKLLAPVMANAQGNRTTLSGVRRDTQTGRLIPVVDTHDAKGNVVTQNKPVTENRTSDNGDKVVSYANPKEMMAHLNSTLAAVPGYAAFVKQQAADAAYRKGLDVATSGRDAPAPQQGAAAQHPGTPGSGDPDKDGDTGIDTDKDGDGSAPPANATGQAPGSGSDLLDAYNQANSAPPVQPSQPVSSTPAGQLRVGASNDARGGYQRPEVKPGTPSLVSTAENSLSRAANDAATKAVSRAEKQIPKDDAGKQKTADDAGKQIANTKPGRRWTKQQREALVQMHVLNPGKVPLDMLNRVLTTGRLAKPDLKVIKDTLLDVSDPSNPKVLYQASGTPGNSLKSEGQILGNKQKYLKLVKTNADTYASSMGGKSEDINQRSGSLQTSMNSTPFIHDWGLDPTNPAHMAMIGDAWKLQQQANRDGKAGWITGLFGKKDETVNSLTPYLIQEFKGMESSDIKTQYEYTKSLVGNNAKEVDTTMLAALTLSNRNHIPMQQATKISTAATMHYLALKGTRHPVTRAQAMKNAWAQYSRHIPATE